ncbi:MAG: bifunctional enoyl-CoA hydratase/phosphate acetyltransferase [candidate division KSB1 bacterium]|nr:bifunctional enoyl-CoA hydratase/phosphate acetyltransferase [candidate division KSB1 bacterium]MDZ7336688.1 bifunctional enoyl-CoA hydratase/phosphate acetyltransferase [candidate division KSB1 bacterium]MDZ7358871.1 bifunctional enoyl-CoA hydratase/phosphate acetyltransferase [candidate division KSB1 bacterium]MDZ7377341.1 bifunctional enoyl-CoA hydratase/phosphate acetyltransferase [candidate division KSB1 bacterium]MDZ7399662.1 bifunctional enoyl-CoA hydratase/phosphate acetyltransferase
MTINNFDQLLEQAKQISEKSERPVRVAIAAANDQAALEAIQDAKKMKLADGLLIGNRKQIIKALDELNIGHDEFEIIEADEESAICRRTVQAIHNGEAELILKGKVKTATLLRAVMDAEHGLRTGRLISDAFLFEWPERQDPNKLMIITDGGFNLAPDLNQKIQILENAVQVMHALGHPNPRVAVVSAVETVNPSLQSTVDAAILAKMNERGQIKGCIVDGPLALDNAISPEAAQQKGIQSPVAGKADILLFPNIESANLTAKGTTYFAKLRLAHATMGAKAPVLIPSRADTSDAKLLTLALNVILCRRANEAG